MVSSDKKLANVVGGKSARACDNCARKRARWYCATDDAFLCQSCDSSVHSANPLAHLHERVRIKSLSSIHQSAAELRISVPSWHIGFSRKARSPRKNKHAKRGGRRPIGNCIRLVPEVSSEDNSVEENEEEILFRVPIFDSCVDELGIQENEETRAGFGPGLKPVFGGYCEEMSFVDELLSSEMDLAEFAADVESLLGNGLEDELLDFEGLGILDDETERELSERVKVEDEDRFIGFGRENFYFDSHNEDYKENLMEPKPILVNNFRDCNKVYDGKKMFLRLDYEGIMSAWDEHKSPWTTGERPELNFDDCWLGDMGVVSRIAGGGGREARVSRYREKRRTRLFSKKIRYEVRKLNAEKRPRMKGRFVKRENFVAPAAFVLLSN